MLAWGNNECHPWLYCHDGAQIGEIPFTILVFQIDEDDPDVLMPKDVVKYVPDALESGECWITKPIVPTEVWYAVLTRCKIVEDEALSDEISCPYTYVYDSIWRPATFG